MSTSLALDTVSASRSWNSRFMRMTTYGSIVFADILALGVAGTIAVIGRALFHAQYHPREYLIYTPGMAVFLIVFSFSGLYPGVAMNIIEEFRLVIRSVSLGFLILIVTTVFVREELLASRIVIVAAWILAIVLIPTSRRIVRGWCCRYTWWGIPTVILAERATGVGFLDLLVRHPRIGLRPVALLINDGVDGKHLSIPQVNVVQGPYILAKELAMHYKYLCGVIATPSLSAPETKVVFDEHINCFSTILVIPDLFGLASLSVSSRDIGGVLVLQMDNRLSHLVPRTLKRLFDVMFSGVLLLVLLPLLIVLVILVKISSEGPVFYGQERIGQNGVKFRVWKFRSMVAHADAVLQAHLDKNPALLAEWKETHKLKRDPRVTPVGRVLRKFSLDELPQIWNVLAGEMSLVGPRPIIDNEISRYGAAYTQYCRVKPGVTGLWQISGRNNTTYELRTQIDDYYVRNWSMSMDFFVLVRTAKTVLIPEGAY